MTWSSGAVAGTGKLLIPQAATVNLGTSILTLQRTLENDGVINTSTGVADWRSSSGTLHNLPSGVFNRVGGGGAYQFVEVTNFNNEGTILRNGSGAATLRATPLTNSGTLTV